MIQPIYLSVSQITRYIRDLLSSDYQLQDCWVEGEVSNYAQAASGHVYFTLKDDAARLSCVMWRSSVERQTHTPKHGEAVVCHGYISVYEAQGRYQFYVDEVQPAGLGILHLQFEALKQKLAAEGLFDIARKRPLPAYPRRIGVVTSAQAAVFRDICHILSRRYPLVHVILAPSLVQGETAPDQIVAALEALAQVGIDVIIVARGGGSLEELWAFNAEGVARAIASSPIPVISGVGHETDFTIADFVADVRAPTPSAAAELAVPDGAELRERIRRHHGWLLNTIQQRLADSRRAVELQQRALDRCSPARVVGEYRQRVDGLLHDAHRAMAHQLALARERVDSRASRLRALDPQATLARGYAIVRHRDEGQLVTSVRDVQAGDPIAVQVKDGTFEGVVGRGKPHRQLSKGTPAKLAHQLGFDI